MSCAAYKDLPLADSLPQPSTTPDPCPPPYHRLAMASDSESAPSTPMFKQEEELGLQLSSVGRKKSGKEPNRPKKRNLVRWDGKWSLFIHQDIALTLHVDNLDKQVLLTLQWACNEQGIKIPCKIDSQH